MHISDVAFECAQQCARLSRECTDRDIAVALFKISERLLAAATRDTELVDDEADPITMSVSRARR